MTLQGYVLAALVLLWCGPAAYFDDNSTLEFLKRKTGREAGLFGFMAWLQARLPRGWTWVKAGLMWVVAGTVVAIMPPVAAIAIMFGLNFLETVAILSNYAASK